MKFGWQLFQSPKNVWVEIGWIYSKKNEFRGEKVCCRENKAEQSSFCFAKATILRKFDIWGLKLLFQRNLITEIYCNST